MFDKAAAFNQDLCGWTTTNGNIASITEECTNGAICGENGTNNC